MSSSLVLSLFPGIGLLDMAFEEEGFCVVRGPDVLWGGDIRRFDPPAGRFDGVIGGPPCQAHSTYAALNRSRGNRVAEDLVPEFVRCIEAARPDWWLMENVPRVPDVQVEGYCTSSILIDARWLGCEQSRKRRWQFGTRDGRTLDVGESLAVLEAPTWEKACLASEGRCGVMGNKRCRVNGTQTTSYTPRRDWPRFCELQGLPSDFLADGPFTVEGRYKMVGNGVPVPMGRAIASAVREALARES